MPYAGNGYISQDFVEGSIKITQKQYLSALEGMLDGKIVSIDKGFKVLFEKIEAEEEKIQEKTDDDLWNDLREIRDYKLLESDRTQLLDWPGDREAWAEYRSELRDFPKNTTDPKNPIWPEKPE